MEHCRAMNEEEEMAGMLVVSRPGDDGCRAIDLEKDVTGSTQHNSLHIQIDRLSGEKFLGYVKRNISTPLMEKKR
jgi:hypothetical protein